MTIIDRYIIRQYLGTFFFMMLVILALSLVIDVAEKIDSFIEHKPPMDLLINSYYVNFLLFYGNLLSPICVFLSVIFFTSRLTQNTEIVALLAGGVNFYRIMAPYVVVSLFLAGCSFFLNAYVVPNATHERIEFEYNYLKTKRVMHDNHIHRKVSTDTSRNAETFVYMYSFNQLINEAFQFSMEEYVGDDISSRLKCHRATFNDSTDIWTLHECEFRTFSKMNESISYRKSIDTTILLHPNDIYVKELRAKTIPLDKLVPYIELEKERGSNIVDELVREKYERYAYPFAAIILTIMGFSVSTKKRRGGTALQLGIGLVLSFLYVVLVVAGQALIGEDIPAWMGVWYPNMMFTVAAIVMIRIAPK